MIPRLLPIPEAADLLGVPAKSLLRAAETHGHLVRMGRSIRVVEDELGELIDKCRSQPKARASFCDDAQDDQPSGSSRIRVNPSEAQARQIAARLKSRSRNTSRESTAEVVPLGQRK